MIRLLVPFFMFFLSGCMRQVPAVKPAEASAEPVYPRSTISDPETKRVAAIVRNLFLERQTRKGEKLFSSCDILPPARSVLPYGVGQYEQQLRLPIIVTTATAWDRLDGPGRRSILADLHESSIRYIAEVPALKGPSITVVNSKGWQVAWLTSLSTADGMFLGDE
jgi:hypothetical protein